MRKGRDGKTGSAANRELEPRITMNAQPAALKKRLFVDMPRSSLDEIVVIAGFRNV